MVGEGLPAPLPKVAVLSEDGQIVGAEDEVEDEAVLDERRMIEGPVRYHLLRFIYHLLRNSVESIASAICLASVPSSYVSSHTSAVLTGLLQEAVCDLNADIYDCMRAQGTVRDDAVVSVHLRKEYRKEKKDKKKEKVNKEKLKKEKNTVEESKEKRSKTIAVEDLSLGLTTGECFGLLGPNGAGKSSSLDMLCGIEPPTRGTVTVGGKSTTEHLAEVHKRTALCPQLVCVQPADQSP